MEIKAEKLFISLRAAIYIGAFVLLSLVQWGTEEVLQFSGQLASQAMAAAAIMVVSAILSDLLPNSAKHSLVYFRLRNALSGHRCKRVCEKDSRLSMERLQKRWPELFGEDMQQSSQNSYWYNEIYMQVRNAPEVLQAHRHFLLYRDAASGLFVLLVGLLLWRAAAQYVSLPSLGNWSLLLLAGIILLLCQAGRQSGNRMVRNAVALAVAKEAATPKTTQFEG